MYFMHHCRLSSVSMNMYALTAFYFRSDALEIVVTIIMNVTVANVLFQQHTAEQSVNMKVSLLQEKV